MVVAVVPVAASRVRVGGQCGGRVGVGVAASHQMTRLFQRVYCRGRGRGRAGRTPVALTTPSSSLLPVTRLPLLPPLLLLQLHVEGALLAATAALHPADPLLHLRVPVAVRPPSLPIVNEAAAVVVGGGETVVVAVVLIGVRRLRRLVAAAVSPLLPRHPLAARRLLRLPLLLVLRVGGVLILPSLP